MRVWQNVIFATPLINFSPYMEDTFLFLASQEWGDRESVLTFPNPLSLNRSVLKPYTHLLYLQQLILPICFVFYT